MCLRLEDDRAVGITFGETDTTFAYPIVSEDEPTLMVTCDTTEFGHYMVVAYKILVVTPPPPPATPPPSIGKTPPPPSAPGTPSPPAPPPPVEYKRNIAVQILIADVLCNDNAIK